MPRQESIEQNDDRHYEDQYDQEHFEMRERYNSPPPPANRGGNDNYAVTLTSPSGSRPNYNMGAAGSGQTNRLPDEDEEDGDWC